MKNLSSVYSNFFNSSTEIKYSLPKEGNVSLKIYDVLGKEIAVLVNSFQASNKYEVNWNASGISSETYFIHLQFDNRLVTQKVVYSK
jgi:hypothetical protein